MTVVTRFPPSPTGFMHIGNARTALLNWLFARSQGGKFLLRIEDTDRKRHSEEAVDAIIRSLKWMGLEWDGDVVSQFARADRHAEIAQQLLKDGKAYYCYCSPDELEEMREDAKKTGRPTAYNKKWRDKPDSEAPEGIQPVIRIKAPLEGKTTIQDQVQGEVSVNNEQIDDFILMRADGTPTYMLAVVVDDHDMGVTHIIRGDDHLNNAFRQKVIFDAMGWDTPIYAHTPLIHGPDGKKFSKRHGAQSVEEYKDMGYLADALFNYLLRLGWSHGDDEYITRKQALEWFSLSGIGKSPSGFDFTKLENLNAQYIQDTPIKELLEKSSVNTSKETEKMIETSANEIKKRCKTLHDFVAEITVYTQEMPDSYEEKAQNLIKENSIILKDLSEKIKLINDLNMDNNMEHFKSIAKELVDGKLGKIGMPLRAALTGKTSSISVFEIATAIGKDLTCKRIQKALDLYG